MRHSTPAQLTERLVGAGQKATPQRVIIGVALARASRAVTAQELFEALKEEHPYLGRATVFRTLDALAEAGLARRFEQRGHIYAYVACEPTDHHHLLCTRCGNAQEIECGGLAQLSALIKRDHGFVVDHPAIDFYGTCARCTTHT